METFKMLLNSTVSTPSAKLFTGDISNMYLNSTLPEPEYVKFKVDLIPPNIIKHYNLQPLIRDGYVYAQINRAIYGLKQSGKIANQDLIAHLRKSGYHPVPLTEGLFVHKTRPTAFSLVVDDFAVRYSNKDDADHLIACLREKYLFKVDWEAK